MQKNIQILILDLCIHLFEGEMTAGHGGLFLDFRC